MRNSKNHIFVIPMQAGIQRFQYILDPDSRFTTCRDRFRRDDVFRDALIMILLLLSIMLTSCGGGGAGGRSGGATGIVKMLVSNSRSFNPNIPHGKILKYKVTVAGPGMEGPIESFFDGDADAGVVDGVPSGADRTVTVEAVNPNNVIIRAGEASGIAISPGELTEVRVDMASVPIFANLSDGNSVPNTFFVARVFSEPDSPVTVEDEMDGSKAALTDLASGGTEVLPDASTFFAVVKPALLAPGPHRFTVRNLKNGRSSTVSAYLSDGARLKAAPLFVGGGTDPCMRIGGIK